MQSQLKVLAPVITRDVTLPNTSKKVPMVMVHVPESTTMMAIPLSTLSQMNNTTASNTITTTASASSLLHKDEEQAKDLLNWTDGIGTLDGCDLRFRINQLGCLELLDSDDESNLEYLASKRRSRPPPPPQPYLNHQQQCQDHNAPMQVQEPHRKVNSNSATSSNNTSSSSSTTITNGTSGFSGSSKKSQKVKQISPGCSLLRDGPDNRRSRASSSATTPTPSLAASQNTTTINTIIFNDKISTSTNGPQQAKPSVAESSQQSSLLEKIIPMKRVNEIKAVIENWSTEDVRNFVESIPGCAGNGQLFESQQIDGKTLMYLDQKDLVDIVHVKLGPAIKIHNAIMMLKP